MELYPQNCWITRQKENYDYQTYWQGTDGQTDWCKIKLSLCACMLPRWHKTVKMFRILSQPAEWKVYKPLHLCFLLCSLHHQNQGQGRPDPEWICRSGWSLMECFHWLIVRQAEEVEDHRRSSLPSYPGQLATDLLYQIRYTVVVIQIRYKFLRVKRAMN